MLIIKTSLTPSHHLTYNEKCIISSNKRGKGEIETERRGRERGNDRKERNMDRNIENV